MMEYLANQITRILSPKRIQLVAVIAYIGLVVAAESIASIIYYLLEGNIPISVHISAIGTVTVISVPLLLTAVILVRTLDSSQKELRTAQASEALANLEVQRRNQIFRSLLDTSVSMHQSNELSDIVNKLMNEIRHLFPNLSIGVVIHGERASVIKHFSTIGINKKEQRILIEEVANYAHPIAVAQRLNGDDASAKYHWEFIPMYGRGRNVIGYLTIKATEFDQASREIVTLFTEQLSAAAENKLLLSTMEKLANTDSLTGLYNRNYFQNELNVEIERALNNKNIPFSIFVIDLNGLKQVNDVFGHHEGDRLIISVANILNQTCRESDIITRSGGDEFVVLCPNTGTKEAEYLRERIRAQEKISQITFTKSKNRCKSLPIRISVGLACSTETKPDKVLSLADERMYKDKEQFYQNNPRYR